MIDPPYQENYPGELDIRQALLNFLGWDVLFSSSIAPEYPFGI